MGLYSLNNYGFLHLLDLILKTFISYPTPFFIYKKICTPFKIENFKFKKRKGKSPTTVEV